MRKDYIDWLRNLAILYLIPYHTARVFDGLNDFYIKGEPNAVADVVVSASYWFMPLLFLLSGVSSRHALQKRTAGAYARERFARLLVPFLFGCLLIVPPQAYYAMRFHLGYQGDYLDFLVKYFTDFSDWSEYAGGISPAHLWFILFLFVISLALLPLMTRLGRHDRLPRPLRGAGLVLVPSLALAALALLPDLSGKNIFVYAAYVLLGFILAADDALDRVEHVRRVSLVVALIGAAGIAVELAVLGPDSGPLAAAWRAAATWAAVLAMLGYGKRYLNVRSKFTAYFNPAAFPVYIVHQTILVAVGFYVVGVIDHGAIPFALIAVGTFVLSFGAYELLRRTGPTRFMFGLKSTRSAAMPLPSRGRSAAVPRSVSQGRVRLWSSRER
ncbi:acyltransferase family protein [Glycomyces paridis]|uniref:Acyltransferase n=1 Tax=Glycomyces paridis TaxID=2126555 RepID=A0A4S8P9X5_9ACTN|nr:acyltransferase [Glycomyces paridis]THV26501.1 acyltransferase [Glycomyces paridis]